jgi:triosephosphate isomerase
MKIIAANWKLHKNPTQTANYFKDFLSKYKSTKNRSVVFFVPATSLERAAQSLQTSELQVGAQNCFWELSGAFTGEVSALACQEIGATWVLLGHSERRSLFFETSEMISKKLKVVQQLALTPLVCIGETLQERDSGQTFAVLKKQLDQSLHGAPSKTLHVAYEPVWAIGTGRIASPQQVQETHLFLRESLNAMGFEGSRILYGGSVKADNSKELLSLPHVDGFLVGGASLEVESFLKIVES